MSFWVDWCNLPLISGNAVIINTTQIYRNRKYRRKGKENEKNKFLGKVLSLALAVTLIAGMVPEMRAKAAEGENSGWIQVTEDNKNDLDTKVAVLDNLSQTTYDNFILMLNGLIVILSQVKTSITY